MAQLNVPPQKVPPEAAARAIHEKFTAWRGLKIEERKKPLTEKVESIWCRAMTAKRSLFASDSGPK